MELEAGLLFKVNGLRGICMPTVHLKASYKSAIFGFVVPNESAMLCLYYIFCNMPAGDMALHQDKKKYGKQGL